MVESLFFSSKKDSFKTSAQLIADSAEKKYVENKLNNIDGKITCDSVSKLNKEDYSKCSIVFDENGIAKVSIVGKGKFDELAVINGTRISAKVIQLELPEYGEAKTFIENIYNDEVLRIANDLKKDNTPDKNIRYYGSNPKNYVSFNNELWRIIGVFGNNVKLIRSEKIGNLLWDSSESSINKGYGVNEWGESTYEDGSYYEGADLMQYLNKMYYGGTDVTCYEEGNHKTTTCPTNKLDSTSKALIDNYTWNLGGVISASDTVAFYKAERGNITGKICTGGDGCNDTVKRTTTWTGYVALPYMTDYAYASSESICETNMNAKDSEGKYVCMNNNWIFKPNTVYWTLSPYALGNASSHVWNVSYVSNLYVSDAAKGYAIFPAIYLKNNVIIESGTGTNTDPYKLQIES